MAESKRDAFQRLAEARTNAVLERIRVLRKLREPLRIRIYGRRRPPDLWGH